MRRAGYKGELISHSLAHLSSQSRPDEVPKLSHDDDLNVNVNDDVVYVNDNANVDVLNGNDNGNFDYNDAD